MFYVADTHAWVFYLLDRLPEKADEVFSRAERGGAYIFVPTIALAECVYLVEGGKIDLDLDGLFTRLRAGGNFIPVPLTLDVVERIHLIRLSEIHDRIIVATAQALGAKALTRDERIIESGVVETIWN